MAGVVLLVLVSLLLVTKEDGAGGHGAQRRVPRAVDRVVTGAVLALVAGGVPEPYPSQSGGLPAASRALFSPRADSMYKPKRRCRAMVYGGCRGGNNQPPCRAKPQDVQKPLNTNYKLFKGPFYTPIYHLKSGF